MKTDALSKAIMWEVVGVLREGRGPGMGPISDEVEKMKSDENGYDWNEFTTKLEERIEAVIQNASIAP